MLPSIEEGDKRADKLNIKASTKYVVRPNHYHDPTTIIVVSCYHHLHAYITLTADYTEGLSTQGRGGVAASSRNS